MTKGCRKMGDNALQVTCDVCKTVFAKTDEHTVPWADLSACNKVCKQRWMNQQQKHK